MARGLLGFDRWTFRLVLLPRRAAVFALAYTLWFGRPVIGQQRTRSLALLGVDNPE